MASSASSTWITPAGVSAGVLHVVIVNGLEPTIELGPMITSGLRCTVSQCAISRLGRSGYPEASSNRVVILFDGFRSSGFLAVTILHGGPGVSCTPLLVTFLATVRQAPASAILIETIA